MDILGINAAFHDSSAALIRDGVPIAAAEEERFSRIKHAKRPVPFLSYQLPFHAIDYCLREGGTRLAGVDHIAYSFDPYLVLGTREEAAVSLPLHPSEQPRKDGLEAWDPLFLAGILNAPRFLVDDVPHHLGRLRDGLRSREDLPRFEFLDHHLSHAASAYHVSGFREAAIFTLDGRGEQTTTLFAVGNGPEIEQMAEVQMPHSLGLLYEHVTSYLGFLRSSDEYKVMALASCGTDRYLSRFRQFVERGDDCGYRVSYAELADEFGPSRARGEPLEQRHFDVARALQSVVEETVLNLASWLRQQSGQRNLCLAGGVALNCLMNSRIRDEAGFERIFVQPAAGDAGTALGAAYLIDARERNETAPFTMTNAYLGPGFNGARIRSALDRAKAAYEEPDGIADATAELIAAGQIVGWFQGRMEFGPRALGARSIVASPMDPNMKGRLNEIKDREDFRPVAPAVLEEHVSEYFDPPGPSPFMLFVHDTQPGRVEDIPAVRHFDGTSRIQTVSQHDSPEFHRLISAFARRTGVPVIINTSFNTLGRPIVCTPEDALECYFTTPLDALAIGPFLLRKTVQQRPHEEREPALATGGAA